MVNVIVDTSVLIEEIRTGSELWSSIKENNKTDKLRILCPSIVLTELWAGKSMNYKSAIKAVEKILSIVTVVDVGQELAKDAGKIIRQYKVTGFDAIIAATCAAYEGKLATLNTKHFVGIKGLKLYGVVK